MSLILGIIITLIVFFVAIGLHEFGHFITARITGMKVLEFGFGIPPRAKKLFTDKKGTDFTLNWLPLGGFVRIHGENIRSPEAFEQGAFMSKKLPQRILALIAGVVMNIFLAWVLFFGIFLFGAKPLSPLSSVEYNTNSFFLPSVNEALQTGFLQQTSAITLQPVEGSIAQKSGIQSMDELYSINGKTQVTDTDLREIIAKNEAFDLGVKRGEQVHTIHIAPENGKIGVAISSPLSINKDFTKKAGFVEASALATKEVYSTAIITFDFTKKVLGKLFFPSSDEEHQEAKKSLGGPIAISRTFVALVENGLPISLILIFTALLSVNLAVMNILPIPALDGGRIVTTILYSLATRIGINKQKYLIYEGYVNTFFFLLLLAFMLYIAGLDISKFFS